MTYWIKSAEENREFLESIDITLGERQGDYWHGCEIPFQAIDDLNEHWGSGDGDTIMFGEYKEQRDLDSLTSSMREKFSCVLCGSILKEDDTCSFPLCESWQVEE